MEKFVYEFERSDGCTYSFTDYICYEAESKEILITGLTCSLLDFQKEYIRIKECLNILNKNMELAMHGSHKIKPNLEEYKKLREEEISLKKKLNKFEFNGKEYDIECFTVDRYSPLSELIDLDRSIIGLNEWFLKNK
jgi:hypothetical protein